MKNQPCCQTLKPWLKNNLGKDSLGPLTGTDARALSAAVHLIELYSIGYRPEVLEAFAITVGLMQPSTQGIAFHSIAHVLDWGDRIELWAKAGLSEASIPRTKCLYEPGGSVWAAPLASVADENRAAVQQRGIK
jgi:hypothetical protein